MAMSHQKLNNDCVNIINKMYDFDDIFFYVQLFDEIFKFLHPIKDTDIHIKYDIHNEIYFFIHQFGKYDVH